MGATTPTVNPTRITTPSDTELRIERSFNAPRDLVFRAYTDPALLVQWLGPRRLKLVIDHLDLRLGGTWRFIHIDTDGSEYGFHGEFLEVVRPKRITQTWIFEGYPDASSVETAEFHERDGRTTVVSVAKFKTREHRDGHIRSGMEEGVIESYDRLDELFGRAG